MRVLDLDASGTISRAEFTRKGRMVYFLVDGIVSASTETESRGSLVEFEFTKEKAKTSTYVGAEINAKDLDRVVVWSNEGLASIFEGRVGIASGLDGIELQADTITNLK